MKCSLHRNRREAGAIRLLDVVAIACVVAVLAFLGVFGGMHLRERARRAKCRTNLEQIGKALQSYAQENNGLLPDCTMASSQFYGPVWPWDLHTNLAAVLLAKGATRETFYCPANAEMNDDRHWNFCNYDPAPSRVVGYISLFKGIRQLPRSLWRERLSQAGPTAPAQTELSLDATAGVDDDFTMIMGLWRDRSNHMRGKRPQGGNILFMDQHVEWRDFSKMQQRFTTVGPGGRVNWHY
jgi:hypothetical protein